MNKKEAIEIIRELVEKFIDVDQSQLTSYERRGVIELIDDTENWIIRQEE